MTDQLATLADRISRIEKLGNELMRKVGRIETPAAPAMVAELLNARSE